MSLDQDVGVLQGKCAIMEDSLGDIKNGLAEANIKLDALHASMIGHEAVLLRTDEVPDLRSMIFIFRTARSYWTKAFIGMVIIGAMFLAGVGAVAKFAQYLKGILG